MKIQFIANAGFLLQGKNKKVLIDGMHTKEVKPFSAVNKDTLNNIIKGIYPFDNLDLLLFTHLHYDHMCIKSVIQSLKNQPHLKLFTTKQAIEAILEDNEYHSSLKKQIFTWDIPVNQTKKFNIDNIDFIATSTEHDGEKYKDIENFSYIVDLDGINIFHCGDTKINETNYRNYTIPADIALLNFPYIALPKGRNIIKNHIRPKQIIVMHLPNRENDVYNWTETLYKVINRYKDTLPEIIVKQ